VVRESGHRSYERGSTIDFRDLLSTDPSSGGRSCAEAGRPAYPDVLDGLCAINSAPLYARRAVSTALAHMQVGSRPPRLQPGACDPRGSRPLAPLTRASPSTVGTARWPRRDARARSTAVTAMCFEPCDSGARETRRAPEPIRARARGETLGIAIAWVTEAGPTSRLNLCRAQASRRATVIITAPSPPRVSPAAGTPTEVGVVELGVDRTTPAFQMIGDDLRATVVGHDRPHERFSSRRSDSNQIACTRRASSRYRPALSATISTSILTPDRLRARPRAS